MGVGRWELGVGSWELEREGKVKKDGTEILSLIARRAIPSYLPSPNSHLPSHFATCWVDLFSSDSNKDFSSRVIELRSVTS